MTQVSDSLAIAVATSPITVATSLTTVATSPTTVATSPTAPQTDATTTDSTTTSHTETRDHPNTTNRLLTPSYLHPDNHNERELRGDRWFRIVHRPSENAQGDYAELCRTYLTVDCCCNVRGGHVEESCQHFAVNQLGCDDTSAATIHKDVPRSYGSELSALDSPANRIELTELLLVFASHYSSIGYTQGMSFIAALVLAHMNKGRALVFLHHVFTMLPPGFYTHAAAAEIPVFVRIVDSRAPIVFEHLGEDRFHAAGFLLVQWILPLFTHVLPLQTTLCVWDYLFQDANSGEGAAPPRLDEGQDLANRADEQESNDQINQRGMGQSTIETANGGGEDQQQTIEISNSAMKDQQQTSHIPQRNTRVDDEPPQHPKPSPINGPLPYVLVARLHSVAYALLEIHAGPLLSKFFQASRSLTRPFQDNKDVSKFPVVTSPKTSKTLAENIMRVQEDYHALDARSMEAICETNSGLEFARGVFAEASKDKNGDRLVQVVGRISIDPQWVEAMHAQEASGRSYTDMHVAAARVVQAFYRSHVSQGRHPAVATRVSTRRRNPDFGLAAMLQSCVGQGRNKTGGGGGCVIN